VNHRIFERTLRPLVFRRACLFECHYILNLAKLALLGLDVRALLASIELDGLLPLNLLVGSFVDGHLV
jgi:hypothetical protein